MKKKIAVTGPHGRIGKLLVKKGAIPIDCDVTDFDRLERAIKSVDPDVIAHLASKSEVDWCEANQREALRINLRGATNVFAIAEDLDAGVAFVSSDHIFDGKRGNYQEVDLSHFKTSSVNYYGILKFGVEVASLSFENVKIVRTSTLFSRERKLIWQYLDPMIQGEMVEVPTFLTRSFMYLPHFVKSFWAYLNDFDEMPDILNIAGGPHPVTWYEFVCDMAEVYGIDRDMVRKRNQEQDGFGAMRPKWAGLNIKRSERLRLPQFEYYQGLKQMREDELMRELGHE